jgi:hypothetical protein
MIAGIAGLCAAVTFGLESANVVGFQNLTPDAGYKNMFGISFNQVGGAGGDIQDVVCKNGTAAPGDSEFRMWWYDLDQLKYVYAVYSASGWADDGMDEGYGTEYADKFYWVSDDDDLFIYAPLGWKHDAEAPATIVDHEKRFAAGEGFFIQPNGALSNPVVTFKNPFND